MSRGNYYYARGWVGSERSWNSGEVDRFSDFGEGLVTSIMLLALGVIIQVFSAFADVSWLGSTLPLFSLVLGIIGVIVMLSISEKGFMYVGGWTFVSILLYSYSLIGIEEFLTDLIPVAILVIYGLAELGVFDGLVGGHGREYYL